VTRRAIRRGLIYAAIVIVPWAVIGVGCAMLAGCAGAPLTISDDPMAPPRAAVYRAIGERDPSFAFPACYDLAFAAFDRMRAAGEHPILVAALTETGEGHMLVEADGLAFDNRYSRPQPIDSLPYRWIEASADGVSWFKAGVVQ
jgi:hypothetical protein